MLTDVLHAPRHRAVIGVLRCPKQRKLTDNHLKILREPHFMTPVELAHAFHVEPSLPQYQPLVNSSEALARPA